MSEINYGSFKADKFDSFTTGNADLDAKIDDGQKELTKTEKLFLGRKLFKLEKKSIGSILRLIAGVFSKKAKIKYQTRRAERYLRVLQSKKISQLKTTPQARNIKLSDIPSSALEIPEIDPTTEKTEQVAQKVVTFSSLEAHKAKSDNSQKNMMANLLNLNVVPDTPKQTIEIHGKQFNPKTLSAVYKENSAEKKVLMAKHLPLEMAPQISAQAKKYPVMNAAVQEIRQNLEQWDGLVLKEEEDGLSNLKQTLAKQFESLGALSDIISSVTTSLDSHGIVFS